MSVNWETFKSNLGCLQNTSVVYIDEEGTEISIDSDLEFQEAIRLAKLNNNHLKFILYGNTVQKSQPVYSAITKHKLDTSINFSPEKWSQWQNNVKKSQELSNSNIKEDTCHCHCNGNVPPEWFIHYMKKFKKDLLCELKANVIHTIENTIDKTRKLPNKKSDILKDLICIKKNGITFITPGNQSHCSTPNKKKKKVLDKEFMEFTNSRAVKMTKKLDDCGEKSEKLEKFNNKTRFLLEEKKKLLQKKNSLKEKSDVMDLFMSDSKINVKKSACEHFFFLFLLPGGEFTINVNIINDRKVCWSVPRLVCFELKGLQVYEPSIFLPKLLPTETCFVTIRGKADKTIGIHHFKFTLVDGEEKIGPQFTCLVRVNFFGPYEEHCEISVRSSDSDAVTIRPGESTGSFIDFQRNLIASSERKIGKNIMEIEKRLKDIGHLRPSTSEETSVENNGKISENPKKMDPKKEEEFKTLNCDLFQKSNENEKNSKEGLDQEDILYGFDCLRLTTERGEGSNSKTNSTKDENEENKKDVELETTSDSELSIICKSEEDETFIVVPLPSKSPNLPAQFENENEKDLNGLPEVKPTAPSEEPSKAEFPKPETKSESVGLVEEADPAEDLHSGQLSPTRTRRSPFEEEISEFKPKKMKSKSSEYYFTKASLTQPTFTPIPNGFFELKPSKFNFTGEKKEGPHPEGRFEKKPSKFNFTGERKEGPHPEGRFEEKPSKFTFTGEKEEKSKKKKNATVRNVPKTDALGRVIYAVNINGYCLPVGDLFKSGEHCRTFKNDYRGEKMRSKIRPDKRNDRFNEIPAVNILPNAFMSGASNIASLAFNTAKSVINNLQSAFLNDWNTELGKLPDEGEKKLSVEAVFRLYEMGFSDLQLNQKLLLKNNNDLVKVVEELVRLSQNSTERFQQFH